MEHEQKPDFAETIVIDREKFEEKKARIAAAGPDKFYVLSDFDRTLTTAYVDGKPFLSLISILYKEHYLSESYAAKAQALHDHYGPIELNHDLPFEERKAAMREWWRKHFDLLIEEGLHKNDIDRAVKSSGLCLRDGVCQFVKALSAKNIPLVILSASGLGTEATGAALKEHGCYGENIVLVGNNFSFSNEGHAVSVTEPIIHALNKDEAELMAHTDTRDIIKNKTNVLVLGDSLPDADMADGLNHDTVLKIGFLNEPNDENLKKYKEKYDALICGDGDFGFINDELGGMI